MGSSQRKPIVKYN